MPELQCYLLRISVWIHLRAFTSINGLIINKFPLSSLGVRLFYKYDELLYWTENILGNLSSETDAKPNSNLPPSPQINKRRKQPCVTGLQWLPVCDYGSKNRTRVSRPPTTPFHSGPTASGCLYNVLTQPGCHNTGKQLRQTQQWQMAVDGGTKLTSYHH